MDLLNKAYARIAAWFRSLSPAARVGVAAVAAASVVALAWLGSAGNSGGVAYLLGGHHFSSAELEAAEAAFGAAKLSDYEIEGNRLRVPREQKARYMGALVEAGAMPAHFGTYLTEALEKSGPWVSGKTSEAMLKLAMQKELAETIGAIDGIESAAVFYDVPKKTGLRQPSASASVSIKTLGDQPLNAWLASQIRKLVAGAVNIPAESVTVVDLDHRTYADGLSGASDLVGDAYVDHVKFYQAEFENKIRAALSYVPGVLVTATVELRHELRRHEERNRIDPAPAAPVAAADPAGSAGNRDSEHRASDAGELDANAPAQLAAVARLLTRAEERGDDAAALVARDHTVTDVAPLTPRRVLVTVGIPSSYYEQIWRQRHPSSAGGEPTALEPSELKQIELDEVAKIRKCVTGLVPPPLDAADSGTCVTVHSFTPLRRAEPATPGKAEQAWVWLVAHGNELGMIVLACCALVVVRPLARWLAAALAARTSAEPAARGERETPRGPHFAASPRGEPSLREELVEMVRRDPDAAADIIRQWIGSAS